jgi:hypothetical protein
VRRQHIDVSSTTPADPATVYALLRDGATWPTWSPLGSFELERPGDTEPEGLGAIRVFRTRQPTGQLVTTRERVAELVPGRRFSYVLLSGLHIRDYRADVDLTSPVPGGTTGTAIRWHSSFVPAVPGTGWLFRLVLGRFIARCARGLAAHAATLVSPS